MAPGGDLALLNILKWSKVGTIGSALTARDKLKVYTNLCPDSQKTSEKDPLSQHKAFL